MTREQAGLMLMLAGAVVDSTSGLFTRLLQADGFTTASGRGFFALVLLLGVLIWRDRRRAGAALAGIGVVGLAFALLNAGGMVMNILSLKYTSVASFFRNFAAAPFVAALTGRAVLGERPETATLLAALAGFAGIAVMMLTGAQAGGQMLGKLLAVGCVLTYASVVLIVRGPPGMDILPVLCLTVGLSGIIAWPFADFSRLTVPDRGLFAVFGMVQLGIGNLLIFAAAARFPPAQSGLLGILNAAFAPAWVFAVLGEVPDRATLLGGAIILGAAVAHLGWTLTRRPAATA